MALAPDSEVAEFLAGHPEWDRAGEAITRTYEFDDFNEAIGFVTRVGLLAEKADHHPDIDIRWNKVKLAIFTHSEGGLTRRDLNFAAATDTYARPSPAGDGEESG